MRVLVLFAHPVEVSYAAALHRATVEALQMNRPLILAIRREGILLGRHPPSTSDTPWEG